MNTLRIAATATLSLAALIGAAIVVAAADRDPCTRLPLDLTASAREPECAVDARDWGPDVRLTSDPHRSLLTLNFAHAVALDALGGVHIVWSDDRDGRFRVSYKRSDDGGATWGADTLLSSASGPIEHSTIAVSGLTVHVAWHEVRDGLPRVRYRRSLDRGRSFGDDTPLALVTSASAHASIAADGRNVHAVWVGSRGGHGEVYTRHSSDDGASWGPETQLSDLPYDSYVPTIAVSGDHVYAAWVDTSDSNEEEYVRASHDGGATWGPITRVTRNPANSWAPSLAAEGETVHLVWFDQEDSPVHPREAERMLQALARRRADVGARCAAHALARRSVAPLHRGSRWRRPCRLVRHARWQCRDLLQTIGGCSPRAMTPLAITRHNAKTKGWANHGHDCFSPPRWRASQVAPLDQYLSRA